MGYSKEIWLCLKIRKKNMLGERKKEENREERKKWEGERETRRGSTGVSNTGICIRLQLCGVPGIQTHQRDQSA